MTYECPSIHVTISQRRRRQRPESKPYPLLCHSPRCGGTLRWWKSTRHQKQKAYIQRLLRAFPDARELLEYEDYLKNQTQESASEFIRQAREDFAVPMSQRENYLDYVSHRPGVELRGEHGLWTSGGKVENLAEAVREVAEHPGNV